MLYHVSNTAGLKTLVPHASTHKTPYVYAVENRVTGLLFGARQDDFDFIISTDENGKPTVCECYPDAFEKIYRGKGCSVYAVDDAGFQRGMTAWSEELVSEAEVKVLQETRIDDLYACLLAEEEQGNLIVRRYEHTAEYRAMVAAHVVDRLIRFDVDLTKCLAQGSRFAVYYRDIVEGLRKLTDGSLLP